jgi:hypothetical protein
MGLYNILFGRNPLAGLLCALAGFTEQPMRLRDAWVERGDGDVPVIAIHTRMGGGNRVEDEPDDSPFASWRDWWERVVEMHRYLRDADDDFDPTYATIYFRAPTLDEILATPGCESVEQAQLVMDLLVKMAQDAPDIGAMWEKAIKLVESMPALPERQ